MSGFDRDAWLARIGLAAPPAADEEGLAAAMRAQLAAIPFENFDILLGRRIDLAPAALAAKLVDRRRGGYCFELNTLLALGLAALGFTFRPLLARLHLAGRPAGRSHMLLLVSLGRRDWIADAGFGGDGLRLPVPVELGRRREQEGDAFLLADAGRLGLVLRRAGPSGWEDLYSFGAEHALPEDIGIGNFFASRSPTSLFTRMRTAALVPPGGRIRLFEDRLTRIEGGRVTETMLPAGAGWAEAVERAFGIRLDADPAGFRPVAERFPGI